MVRAKGEYRCDLLATPEKRVFIDTSRFIELHQSKEELMESRGAVRRIEEATCG
jgi:aromatic ring hydroxylase